MTPLVLIEAVLLFVSVIAGLSTVLHIRKVRKRRSARASPSEQGRTQVDNHKHQTNVRPVGGFHSLNP
jgi:hypothetical protein